MEYTTLTGTGMEVSRICFGTMSLGTRREWGLDKEQSEELIDRAIDLGINFFDTANMYSRGESESILGDALAKYDRDSLVIGTKGYYQLDNNPNAGGLSRKAIDAQLNGSLDRLGMDTVDLYQIHRWDYETPIKQTLRALDDAVRQGKTRYVGASSMWAHQFAEALHLSELHGLERFATMQNHYNLVYREEEREMLPLCEREDIGVTPWSPLARGYLTRPHDSFDTTVRAETDSIRALPYMDGGGPEINRRVQELSKEKGVTMAQIALAWHLHNEWVDAPIVGTANIEHLEDAVQALEVDLSGSELDYLEAPYRPVAVAGHGRGRTPDRHLDRWDNGES